MRLIVSLCALTIAACASKAPTVPYPANIRSEDIPDSFLAALPDTRSKVFRSDSQSRRKSMLLQLPTDWSSTTGAAPDKTLELYVLTGDVKLGEFELGPGGYAYLPSGSLGVNMSSTGGAMMLYFLDDVLDTAVIETPIISNSDLLEWQPMADDVLNFGISEKELRYDPGSGARTWLRKIEPGTSIGWEYATATQEGFLISGEFTHAECVNGVSIPGEYRYGGYFLRPPTAVNGGPDANALTPTIWMLRVPSHVEFVRGQECVVPRIATTSSENE